MHAAAIVTAQPYVPPAWMPGGHAQSIWPSFLARPQSPRRRERVEIGDGDFWDFDWLATPAVPSAPLVVMFHGLEGSSQSHYTAALFARLAELGLRGVVPHFRGCGDDPNRLPRAYHSGDHAEIGRMLAAIRARVEPTTLVYAAGVSLGGSALLNWLGRAGAGAASTLAAAAAISTPLDLTAGGISIGQGLNFIYTRYFLRDLKPKALAMAQRFPGTLDIERLRAIRSMYDFDDAVTSPLHGFTGTPDYWSRGSSKPWLTSVAIPTLVLNARNDPFIPASSLPAANEASASVVLEQPEGGGHAGFATGPFPGRLGWLPDRLLSFFLTGA